MLYFVFCCFYMHAFNSGLITSVWEGGLKAIVSVIDYLSLCGFC